jgi:8-oxo-dGTP pyrophosphatase MutT (NUDIX family)
MAENRFWRNIATIVQHAPWLVYTARAVWRIRQPRFTAGVVAVVLNEAGQVLLVEHVFHPHYPWGLPGGWVDRHENPAETILRELSEELGLNAELGPLLLAEISFGNHLDLAYRCYLSGRIGKLSSELLDYRWIDPMNLPRLHTFHHKAIQQALGILTPIGL